MKKNVLLIKSQKDLAEYWRSCLNEFENYSDIEIAYNIVNVAANDMFMEWYREGGTGEKDIVTIFDTAAELEVPQGDNKWRSSSWKKIRLHLSRIEDKY